MERKEYYKKIWQYKKRRVDYKKKYCGNIPVSKTERYRRLTDKISQWNNEIKRLDKRKKIIKKLLDAVNGYFGVKVQSRSRNKQHDLARKIYFKIGMESQISGIYLSKFIGRRHPRTAGNARSELTESFKLNPKNHEAFHKFKKYFENKN